MDISTDVLIVGTGVAGLYAALNLRNDLKITMISKGKLDECNTNLAQGGISVARGYTDIDSFIEDTLKAGQYENDVTAVKILAEESIENINNLSNMGVDFDKDREGLCYTREAAHSINRIVHYKDITGKRLEEVLLSKVKSKDNIIIHEDCHLIDILKKYNICTGGICINNNKQINIHAKVTILATGGIGGIFKNSTNQRIITGDGIAIALRNGVKVKNLNYIQFHPTAFFTENLIERKFLISESVRGEGGKLINCRGASFVNELLPRDVVTKHIYEEELKTKSKNVYLDISFMPKNFIIKRFPNIYKKCLENGVDITKEAIPVSPAQHYFMGGIDVDSYGKTSMKNLYAFGEVSCTGIHGANRLASNSLLEGLVFSKRGALHINNKINDLSIVDMDVPELKYNQEYYENINKKILIDNIMKFRGDLKDELVTC
jgi:L-aspartate oxidase